MRLKYGMNPHQPFATAEPVKEGQSPISLLHGTPSVINLLDALSAWASCARLASSWESRRPPLSNTYRLQASPSPDPWTTPPLLPLASRPTNSAAPDSLTSGLARLTQSHRTEILQLYPTQSTERPLSF